MKHSKQPAQAKSVVEVVNEKNTGNILSCRFGWLRDARSG